MAYTPQDIDIRLAVGEPRGEQALKMICPMHRERLGVEDDVGSLAVYRANIHCYGCGYHLRRRYSSLAFLLGVWDGKGSEDGERCRAAVRRIQPRLQEFVSAGGGVASKPYTPPPPDPVMVEAFHQFLLTVMEDRLVDELMVGRGLTLETVKEYKLGHTGTHFAIPVFDLDGSLLTIRYRSDERYIDTGGQDYRKYEGTWGSNAPVLYPLQRLHGVSSLEEVWVVEGEFDAIATNQAGDVALTVTNGATSIDKLPGLLFDAIPTLLIGSWVLATDQDQAGDKAADRIGQVLSESGRSWVRARWPDSKDLTEFYAAGGSRRHIWFE